MIKKMFLAICLFIPTLVQCQIEKPIQKGNIILGGNGSINYTKFEDPDLNGTDLKQFNININPTLNYFLIDNLAIGTTVYLGLSHQENSNTKNIGIGPNIKYYFGNGILIRSEALYSISTGNISKSRDLSFKAGVGYAFFINSKVSIEPTLLYCINNGERTILERDLGSITIPEVIIDNKNKILLLEIGFHIFM